MHVMNGGSFSLGRPLKVASRMHEFLLRMSRPFSFALTSEVLLGEPLLENAPLTTTTTENAVFPELNVSTLDAKFNQNGPFSWLFLVTKPFGCMAILKSNTSSQLYSKTGHTLAPRKLSVISCVSLYSRSWPNRPHDNKKIKPKSWTIWATMTYSGPGKLRQYISVISVF